MSAKDGVGRVPLDKGSVGKALVSVKGGCADRISDVRGLLGTVNTRGAQMGVLITMGSAKPGMAEAANHAGTYDWPEDSEHSWRIQLVTAEQLLAGGTQHAADPEPVSDGPDRRRARPTLTASADAGSTPRRGRTQPS